MRPHADVTAEVSSSASTRSLGGDAPGLATIVYTPLISHEVVPPLIPPPDERDEPSASSKRYCALPNDLRRRNAAICSLGTSLSLIGFAIIFLVAPRETSALFTEFYHNSTEGLAAPSALTFSGKFRFENHNFFSVSWSNLSTEVFWLPAFNFKNSSIPEACSGSIVDPSQTCDASLSQSRADDDLADTCFVSLGVFSVALPAKTAWREEAELSLGLAQNTAQMACSEEMLRRDLLEDQALLIVGQVNAESALRNFGSLPLKDSRSFASTGPS